MVNTVFLCWYPKSNQKELIPFPPSSWVVLLSCEKCGGEQSGIPRGRAFLASSRAVQVCESRPGVGPAVFLSPRRPWLRRHLSTETFSCISSPASSQLTQPVMPQSNVYDLTVDHHGRSTNLRLLRSKSSVEMLDGFGRGQRRPLFIKTTCEDRTPYSSCGHFHCLLKLPCGCLRAYWRNQNKDFGWPSTNKCPGI